MSGARGWIQPRTSVLLKVRRFRDQVLSDLVVRATRERRIQHALRDRLDIKCETRNTTPHDVSRFSSDIITTPRSCRGDSFAPCRQVAACSASRGATRVCLRCSWRSPARRICRRCSGRASNANSYAAFLASLNLEPRLFSRRAARSTLEQMSPALSAGDLFFRCVVSGAA